MWNASSYITAVLIWTVQWLVTVSSIVLYKASWLHTLLTRYDRWYWTHERVVDVGCCCMWTSISTIHWTMIKDAKTVCSGAMLLTYWRRMNFSISREHMSSLRTCSSRYCYVTGVRLKPDWMKVGPLLSQPEEHTPYLRSWSWALSGWKTDRTELSDPHHSQHHLIMHATNSPCIQVETVTIDTTLNTVINCLLATLRTWTWYELNT